MGSWTSSLSKGHDCFYHFLTRAPSWSSNIRPQDLVLSYLSQPSGLVPRRIAKLADGIKRSCQALRSCRFRATSRDRTSICLCPYAQWFPQAVESCFSRWMRIITLHSRGKLSRPCTALNSLQYAFSYPYFRPSGPSGSRFILWRRGYCGTMCDYTQVNYECGHVRYVVKAWCTRYQETWETVEARLF